MKQTKVLAAGALTALLTMAFTGTSPAMGEAAKLCQTDESSCTEISHLHMTTLNGIESILLSSIINVKCQVLFLGDSLGGGVYHGRYTFIGCMGSCEVKEVGGPVILEILKTSHETAGVTGEWEVNVHCGFFINCTYNGENLEGTAKGPLLSSETNGEIAISGQEVSRVSGFCPENAFLDTTVTPLSATYISS